MREPRHETSQGARVPALYLFGGLAIAGVSAVLAGVAGGPYLSLEALNPWVAVFAVGLFVALFATPFAIHRGLGGLLEADARWERALLWWGAVSLAVLGVGLLCGLPSDFASDSLAGSIGLVAVVEAVMVLATLVVWLLEG